jgi:hypothetical protein
MSFLRSLGMDLPRIVFLLLPGQQQEGVAGKIFRASNRREGLERQSSEKLCEGRHSEVGAANDRDALSRRRARKPSPELEATMVILYLFSRELLYYFWFLSIWTYSLSVLDPPSALPFGPYTCSKTEHRYCFNPSVANQLDLSPTFLPLLKILKVFHRTRKARTLLQDRAS